MPRTRGARGMGKPLIDPMTVFHRMIETGNREIVTRENGFKTKSGLLSAADRQAHDQDAPALLFAIQAGQDLHNSRRSQRIAGIQPLDIDL